VIDRQVVALVLDMAGLLDKLARYADTTGSPEYVGFRASLRRVVAELPLRYPEVESQLGETDSLWYAYQDAKHVVGL